jgi:hypothetical protein
VSPVRDCHVRTCELSLDVRCPKIAHSDGSPCHKATRYTHKRSQYS